MNSSEVLFNLLETEKATGFSLGLTAGALIVTLVAVYVWIVVSEFKKANNKRRKYLESVDDESKLKYYQFKYGDE